MSNVDFEKHICNISTRYIYNQALTSLLLLLNSAIEEEKSLPLPYDIPGDILEIKDKVRNFFISLEDILSSKEKRFVVFDQCNKLKADLLKKYESIHSYFLFWEVLSTVLAEESSIRYLKKQGVSDNVIDWNKFIKECNDFLDDEDDIFEQKNRIGQLLKCTPMKIARERYFDIIKNSLNHALDGESEINIDTSLRMFSSLCTPDKLEDFGTYFDDIADWFISKKSIVASELTDEALEDELDGFHDTYDTLAEIEDYFNCIYNDINSLIILVSINYTYDDLLEEEDVVNDLYHAVAEILSGEIVGTEKEAILDVIVDKLEATTEKYIDKSTEAGRKMHSLQEKIGDLSQISKDNQKLILFQEYIKKCYFERINDNLFYFSLIQNFQPASQQYKVKAIDTFIENLRNYFADMPILTRRVAMKMLLAGIPLALTVNEAMQMFKNAVDTAPSAEHRALIVTKVDALFDDYGIDIVEDDIHHEHGSDCGCGHHH